MLADQAVRRSRQGNHFRTGLGAWRGRVSAPPGGWAVLTLLPAARQGFCCQLQRPSWITTKCSLNEKKYTYYGRVVRQNGWTILQYWFFYCFNSWRSGFHGVNDHESDWEMANIYLYEENGQLLPEWVAYASHDFKGDDLRRRWDDQDELKMIDGHPIIFAGAGSHASYFRRGEYQAQVDLPLPNWFSGLIRAWNKLWTDTLGQPPLIHSKSHSWTLPGETGLVSALPGTGSGRRC